MTRDPPTRQSFAGFDAAAARGLAQRSVRSSFDSPPDST